MVESDPPYAENWVKQAQEKTADSVKKVYSSIRERYFKNMLV